MSNDPTQSDTVEQDNDDRQEEAVDNPPDERQDATELQN